MKPPRSILTISLLVALIAVAIPALSKNLETNGKFANPRLISSLTTADFDGDCHRDLAISDAEGFIGGAYRYRVSVHLYNETDSSFLIESIESQDTSFGLTLLPLDVDGDRDLDFVVAPELGFRLIGVWINDGHGTFTRSEAANPPAFIWPPDHSSVELWIVRESDFLLAESGIPWRGRPAYWTIAIAPTELCPRTETIQPCLVRYDNAALFRAPPLSFLS
jgi:hypothetical protein